MERERPFEYHQKTVNITSKVVDCHGQTQALLTCSASGVWLVHPTDNIHPFTVKFDDPSFRSIIASKQPWDHVEWNTLARINILLELLYWVFILKISLDVTYTLTVPGIKAVYNE